MQFSYWSPIICIVALSGSACNGDNSAALQPIDAAVETRMFAANGDDGAGEDLLTDGGPQRAAASTQPAEPAKITPAMDAAKSSDSEKCVKFVMPSDCKNPDGRPLPSELRCTGLYGTWGKRQPACGVHPYAPAYELWSDGAKKQRWFSLPEGASIDASKPEAFLYPVGTQFWEEFRIQVYQSDNVNGQERVAETRLLRKTDKGWVYTSYVWDEKGEHATQRPYGETD